MQQELHQSAAGKLRLGQLQQDRQVLPLLWLLVLAGASSLRLAVGKGSALQQAQQQAPLLSNLQQQLCGPQALAAAAAGVPQICQLWAVWR